MYNIDTRRQPATLQNHPDPVTQRSRRTHQPVEARWKTSKLFLSPTVAKLSVWVLPRVSKSAPDVFVERYQTVWVDR